MAKRKNSKEPEQIIYAPIAEQPICETLETNFMPYAMSVIISRAIPEIDGLKPAHRKLLYTMYKMGLLGGKLTKSANVVGQTMKLNPHGDAAIYETMVRLTRGNEALLHPLVESQGNFGKQYSRDMAYAASRYTEVRLDPICNEFFTDINKNTVEFVDNYDGELKEPVLLPVAFPNILVNPNQGIAVGMASKILPHNFNELIDASVKILEGEDFTIYPDFPTGGSADCSNYKDGARGGSVKVRAKIEKIDKNTVAITEIPYGKTSHILIDSILKAKDKGKIKIKKIEDMTTEKVEILIHLPNDVSPDKTIDALYAFTDCECNIAPNACVIVDNKPQFLSVKDILIYDTNHTRDLLKWQLDIRLAELEDQWHYTSLERIFFENKVYKILEQNQNSWEQQLQDVFTEMKTYQDVLRREILMEDIERLVEKPVRKISKFDTKAIDEKIAAIEAEMETVKNNIEHITEYTIDWFKMLKAKYGKPFVRQTEITAFESIAVTKVVSNNAKLYANYEEGFVGLNLKKDDNGTYICDCSDLSEVIVIGKDGKYRITKVTDKAFFWKDLLYVGVFNRGDSRTIYNVIYREGKSSVSYAKRFAITSVTRDKDYDITTGEEGSKILWFTVNHNGEAESVRIYLRPRPKLKKTQFEYDFSTLAIKGKASRGNLVSKNPIARIQLKSKGVSTIGGKDIWYDADIQKLNDEQRGQYLGEFGPEDKVLAIFKDGTFYTTSFDVSNRYQGEVIKVEKFDPNKTYTALYYDAAAKAFYVKRFSFVLSDNTPLSFIAPGTKSYLVALSEDKHPQFQVIFGGKYEHRDPENIDAEEYIAKKGYAAKGKKCHQYDLKEVKFIEPLHKPEDDIEDEPLDIIDDVESDEPQGDSNEVSGATTDGGQTSAADLLDSGDIPDVGDIDEPTLF